MKLRRITQKDGYTAQGWVHWCPGCEHIHAFAVETPFGNGAHWSFDGNMDRPTFTPSMNIGPSFCHYFLRDGRIQFLDDCRHNLRGQTLELPDIPAEDR